MDNAYAAGALLIAAAGENTIEYPAKYNNSVIPVGAVYPNLTRPLWSPTGPELEFVAPGVNIYSTWLDRGYANATGTSMAVPHVTATAALIWSSKIDPEYDLDGDGVWSNVEMRQKLRHLALDLGPYGRDNEYGWGLINAWATNQRPLGDINVDYQVDMVDLYIAWKAFGSYPGYPTWDPRADIDINNTVDMTDLWIVSKNYGKVDP